MMSLASKGLKIVFKHEVMKKQKNLCKNGICNENTKPVVIVIVVTCVSCKSTSNIGVREHFMELRDTSCIVTSILKIPVQYKCTLGVVHD